MLSNDAHIAYHVQTNTNKQKYLAHYLFCNIFCILSDFYWNPIGIPDSYRILVKLGGDCKVLMSATKVGQAPFSAAELAQQTPSLIGCTQRSLRFVVTLVDRSSSYLTSGKSRMGLSTYGITCIFINI